MADLTKKEQTNSDDGTVPATPEAVAADAAQAAPKADELQKRREAVADAGLAHGSMNNGIPASKDDFSEAEVKGDTARTFPDNVSENTKRANKENDEAQGGSSEAPGQPAVGSNDLRDPGVSSSATGDLPEGDPTPDDTVAGSGDENSQESVEGDSKPKSGSSSSKPKNG